jgi:folate-binding protein YgfZ
MASRAASIAGTRYGPLWGRGYESLVNRRILSVVGTNDQATSYLQGLVTSDLYKEPRAPRLELSNDVRSSLSSRLGTAGDAMGGEKPGEVDDANEEKGEVDAPVEVRFTSMLRSTCFLDHRGRIITDALLWRRSLSADKDDGKENDVDQDPSTRSKTNTTDKVEYLIDVPSGSSADALLSHLRKHKLRRSNVVITDASDKYTAHAVYGTLNAHGAPDGYISAMDPRHPSLGMRVLSIGNGIARDDIDLGGEGSTNATATEMRVRHFESIMDKSGRFPPSPGTYAVLRKLAGVAEGDEINARTAIESNMEFLNAISFDKGCYLGQELTARSNFTGVVRKRILPLMIIDTETEVPRPWVMAGMMQELGEEGGVGKVFGRMRTVGEENGGGEDTGTLKLGGHIPPPLPRLSAPGAGSIASMLMGSVNMTASMSGEDDAEDDDRRRNEQLDRLRTSSQRLRDEVGQHATPGASIIDKKDGKTIGKVVSSPASGTTVLLAQMRLDRLGLLGGMGSGWSRTNRILIGECEKEYRYLPYLPLWWPEIDGETGKEKVVVAAAAAPAAAGDDDELDEL